VIFSKAMGLTNWLKAFEPVCIATKRARPLVRRWKGWISVQ
jgi:hypothetical protein